MRFWAFFVCGLKCRFLFNPFCGSFRTSPFGQIEHVVFTNALAVTGRFISVSLTFHRLSIHKSLCVPCCFSKALFGSFTYTRQGAGGVTLIKHCTGSVRIRIEIRRAFTLDLRTGSIRDRLSGLIWVLFRSRSRSGPVRIQTDPVQCKRRIRINFGPVEDFPSWKRREK